MARYGCAPRNQGNTCKRYLRQSSRALRTATGIFVNDKPPAKHGTHFNSTPSPGAALVLAEAPSYAAAQHRQAGMQPLKTRIHVFGSRLCVVPRILFRLVTGVTDCIAIAPWLVHGSKAESQGFEDRDVRSTAKSGLDGCREGAAEALCGPFARLVVGADQAVKEQLRAGLGTRPVLVGVSGRLRDRGDVWKDGEVGS
jgi:hypothetical protein